MKRATLPAGLALALFGGAPLWGGSMALTLIPALYLQNRMQTSHLAALVAIYVAGGLLGWCLAVPVAAMVAKGRSMPVRALLHCLALTAATIAVTAVLFAIQYRLFYARWHEPFGTRIWAFQFLFTSAAAVYQFLVLGTRLYVPAGPVFLLFASLFLARRLR